MLMKQAKTKALVLNCLFVNNYYNCPSASYYLIFLELIASETIPKQKKKYFWKNLI